MILDFTQFDFTQVFELFRLNVFDLGAAFAMAFFVLRGAMRGVTGEIISIFGLAASFFCGWVFALPMSAEVLEYFPAWSPAVAKWACAVVIFIGVYAAFALFGKIMKILVRATKLSSLDHILEESVMGAVFGGVRACVLVVIIYGAMSIFSPALLGKWMEDSAAMKGASAVWPAVYEFITDKGWINHQPVTNETEVLPDYLDAAPASDE